MSEPIHLAKGRNTVTTYAPSAAKALEDDGWRRVDQPEPQYTDLPEDYPGLDLLQQIGLVTFEDVQHATDERLLAIEGLGPVTLKKIREFKFKSKKE